MDHAHFCEYTACGNPCTCGALPAKKKADPDTTPKAATVDVAERGFLGTSLRAARGELV